MHPGDNGKTPPMCVIHDDALIQIGERLDEHDGKFGAILRELGDISETSTKTYTAALRAADEAAAVHGELQDERKQQRRECDLRHEQLRPTTAPIDYDPDENTMHGRESPELAASLWKARNAESIEREALLREQLATAQATIAATNAERDRQSIRAEKADDRRWSNRQKAGAIVVSVIVALGGLAGLAQLLK